MSWVCDNAVCCFAGDAKISRYLSLQWRQKGPVRQYWKVIAHFTTQILSPCGRHVWRTNWSDVCGWQFRVNFVSTYEYYSSFWQFDVCCPPLKIFGANPFMMKKTWQCLRLAPDTSHILLGWKIFTLMLDYNEMKTSL